MTPNQVNIKLNFEGGGTNFSSAFSTVYDVMIKYIQNECIKFIFMTDG